ncbi:DUF7352 domain-containing protein [Paenibacillus konkukensis]|uniref:DUF7352 domain-containing protein n=1 Tax=Paenibacillus konkukensis TaxID=2020716 RepID=UPI003D9AB7CB
MYFSISLLCVSLFYWTYCGLELPLGSQILSVKEQRNEVVLYALVNPDEEIRETYNILVYGTVHDIEVNISDYEFLDSVLLQSGSLVFHYN